MLFPCTVVEQNKNTYKRYGHSFKGIYLNFLMLIYFNITIIAIYILFLHFFFSLLVEL